MGEAGRAAEGGVREAGGTAEGGVGAAGGKAEEGVGEAGRAAEEGEEGSEKDAVAGGDGDLGAEAGAVGWVEGATEMAGKGRAAGGARGVAARARAAGGMGACRVHSNKVASSNSRHSSADNQATSAASCAHQQAQG